MYQCIMKLNIKDAYSVYNIWAKEHRKEEEIISVLIKLLNREFIPYL